MNTGHRLAEGEPTVPMVTVSTAPTGATGINVATTKPSAARPSVLIVRMIISVSIMLRPNRRQRAATLSQSVAHRRDVWRKARSAASIDFGLAKQMPRCPRETKLR
jgi:hypothetical protein